MLRFTNCWTRALILIIKKKNFKGSTGGKKGEQSNFVKISKTELKRLQEKKKLKEIVAPHTLKNVFIYSKNDIARNNQQYVYDVKNSIDNEAPSRGVKGPCLLNVLAKIPEQILYCEMHVVHRGPFEDLLDLWLNSIYSDKKWYIGKYLIEILLIQF